MDAKNFNFALKLAQNGFLATNLVFTDQNILTRKKFSDIFATAQN